MTDFAPMDRAGRWMDPQRARDPSVSSALGAWPTPPEVARWMASALLENLPDVGSRRAVVLDPACGGGRLLLAVSERLLDHAAGPGARHVVLEGWDVDADAVAASQATLAHLDREAGAVSEVRLRRVDALSQERGEPVQGVILNPPWVDAARMTRAAGGPARRSALAARFSTARGAWDLWVPFVQLALDRVAEGGVVVALVPEALRSASYARALRAYLDTRADVVAWQAWSEVDLGVGARAVAVVLVRRPEGAPARPPPWAAADPLEGSRVGDWADVSGAATVSEAYAWKGHLGEGQPDDDLLAVVNTGTIAPWHALWGHRPLRYLGGRWLRPVLPVTALSPRRVAQARAAKLIVPGLVKEPMVLPDPHGRWLAAKSTVLVLPHDPADLGWLAAWLGSEAAWVQWRALFPGLALRGGWLRVGVRELASLPVPALHHADRSALSAAVDALTGRPDVADAAALQGMIDAALQRAR